MTLRLDLSKAMWASPWAENKLILQDYLAGEMGSRLMAAMREAMGDRAGQLEDALLSVGNLDIYPPFAEQRRHWNPNSSVAVLGIYDPDSRPVPGFLPNGDPFSYEGNPAPAPDVPVLGIHRAEGRSPRTTTRTSRGLSVPGIALDWTPNADTTYWDEVKNFLADAIGDAEIIVKFQFEDVAGRSYALAEWGPTTMGVGVTTSPELGWAIFDHVVPDSSQMVVWVGYYEDDTGGQGNPDFYGSVEIDWTEEGYFAPIYDYQSPTTLVGRVRLVWQAAGPQEIDSLSFNRATYSNMTEGTSATLIAKAYDTNGYLIGFSDPNNDDADVTSRWSGNTNVVTIGSPESESDYASMTLNAIDAMGGSATWIYVTAGLRGSVTDSLNISVTECHFGICQQSGGWDINP